MPTWGFFAIGIVVVGVVLSLTRKRPMAAAMKLAEQQGEVEPLVTALEATSGDGLLTGYDKAISTLWRAYQRDVAAKLIVAFAERHPETPTAQYWLQQVKGVEPEIYQEHLGDDFYAKYYRGEIAAKCGKFG